MHSISQNVISALTTEMNEQSTLSEAMPKATRPLLS